MVRTDQQTETWYSLAELAKEFRVSREKIASFIRDGLLQAMDIAAADSSRPQWRVSATAWADFVMLRSSGPKQITSPPRTRRAPVDAGVEQVVPM